MPVSITPALAQVIRALAVERAPLTTEQVAAKIGIKHSAVSSRLSKMADYGLIDREYRKDYDHGMHRKVCLWSARA